MFIQALMIENAIKQAQDEALNITDDKEREEKLAELDEQLKGAEQFKFYAIPFAGPFIAAAHLIHHVTTR